MGGPQHRRDHPPLCWTREGCPLCCVLRRQPSDRLRIPRQDHQALEHPWRVHVHHRRAARGPLRVGLLRVLLPQRCPPTHRVWRLGQAGQGLEPVQLQAPHQPHRTLRLHQRRDRVPMLWALNEGKRLYSLPCDQGDIIHALCFSPNRYWLCAATDMGIRIWDLEGKGIVDELKLELPPTDAKSKALPTACVSLAWSSDGNTLFAGYTDSHIRVWQVTTGQVSIY